MGLACAGGCLLAAELLAFLAALAILITLTLTIRHGARASVFTGILLAPIFWLLGLRDIEFWIAIAVGAVLAFRFLIDWNRQYRELWLDREQPS
jgi:glycerol-3-phosphate acyltransferase PlsY